MPSLPALSSGVLVSFVGDAAVAFDLVTEVAHRLNHTAGMVLSACDGVGDLDETVKRWAAEAGVDPSVVAADFEVAIDLFVDLGLVGRDSLGGPTFVRPELPVGSDLPRAKGSHTGQVHRVMDHRIVFRSTDWELVDRIDSFLGTGSGKRMGAVGAPDPGVLVADAAVESSGELVLHADRQWRFSDEGEMLDRLVAVLNEYATLSRGCVVFHAAGLRSPEGEVVLFPAVSGSGKSTLAAALIAAGWDYLGDEAIGIRPGSLVAVGYPKRLSFDSVAGVGAENAAEARHTDPAAIRGGVRRLCGDVAQVDRIVLPTFRQGAPTVLESLDPQEAVIELMANTFNLTRVGQPGLDTICALAESVPVSRLSYGDTAAALSVIG